MAPGEDDKLSRAGAGGDAAGGRLGTNESPSLEAGGLDPPSPRWAHPQLRNEARLSLVRKNSPRIEPRGEVGGDMSAEGRGQEGPGPKPPPEGQPCPRGAWRWGRLGEGRTHALRSRERCGAPPCGPHTLRPCSETEAPELEARSPAVWDRHPTQGQTRYPSGLGRYDPCWRLQQFSKYCQLICF